MKSDLLIRQQKFVISSDTFSQTACQSIIILQEGRTPVGGEEPYTKKKTSKVKVFFNGTRGDEFCVGRRVSVNEPSPK